MITSFGSTLSSIWLTSVREPPSRRSAVSSPVLHASLVVRRVAAVPVAVTSTRPCWWVVPVCSATPRDYSFKLNKKVKQLARKSALSYKAQENAIVVVEDFDMEAPKTKEFVAIAKNLKADGKKILLLMPEANKNVYMSARNLQKAEVLEARKVNTYKVLNADVLVVTENSLKAIDEILG